MKCKVITTGSYNLEDQINDWLETGKYEIVNILQSQSELYITVTIFYLDKNEIRAKKLIKLNNINK